MQYFPLSRKATHLNGHAYFWEGRSKVPGGGYCSAVPPQLGAESDRAPCPAPVVCARRLSLPTTSLVLPSPCRLSLPHQRNLNSLAGLAGPGAYTSWSGPLHTCTILFVSLFCPPSPTLCPIFASVSLFLFCCSPHFVPLLGSLSRSNRVFWGGLGVPVEGMTPLSSPQDPSLTTPPAKPCLPCVVPSLSAAFQIFPPPFPPANLSLLSLPLSPGPVWPLS